MQDYYEILESNSQAGTDEIKANYRRLAMKWHPDRNPGDKSAEERFKNLAAAWSVLGDPQKRRMYDEQRAGRSAGMDGFAQGWPGEDREQASSATWQWSFNARQETPFGFGFAFTAQDAADLFTREMMALAMELSLQNIPWSDIARELEHRGCPREVAKRIARDMEDQRKAYVRAGARPWFVRSALSAFFGLSLFGAFWGVGFGLLGLMGFVMLLSGGWNLARALYHLATGNAPRRLV